MRIKVISLAIILASVMMLCTPAAADETAASELTAVAEVAVSAGGSDADLTDGSESTYVTVPAGGNISVTAEGISALYVKFHLKSKPWTAVYAFGETAFGINGYLHEYAELPSEQGSVTMQFSEETEICEIRIFGEGTPPSDVQVWEKPFEKADAILLSTHNDDDQLFFAGLIPYCVANDIDLQVVYFCHHDDKPIRLHEQLNGLWASGATHYPAIGIFPDLYSESMEWAVNSFAYEGYEREDFVSYQCEMIRRFKPEVVIAHDIEGEYGHGSHRLNTDTLIEALELTADPAKYPESAEKYGTWDVPKTYIHLYGERQIVMNYDEPLECFGGKTAYQMSVAGYRCHNTQQWTWFTDWLVGTDEEPITAASQIEKYSPCEYGLYRTTVGDDVKGEMFENVTLRKDVPPETQPPQTTAIPDDTTDATEQGTAAPVTTTSPSPSDTPDEPKTVQADTVFIIAVVAIIAVGGMTALVMIKRD